MDALKKHIRSVCEDQFLVCNEDDDQEMSASHSGSSIGSDWSDKILQLYQVSRILWLLSMFIMFLTPFHISNQDNTTQSRTDDGWPVGIG